MFFDKSTVVAFSLLASSSLVAGHGAITGAVGDAGGQGSAIGVDPNTPRDGTKRNPFQQDSTRFRGANKATCGQTLGGGENNIQAGTAQVMQLNGGTLPQITPGGQIMMTLHQVNSDGAGPYKCMIDASGTGTNWQPIQVTQNLPGNAQGRNKDTQKQDQPLTAAIPAGQTCTGTVAGQSNVCMIRCENPARAGPFGGCVPVQMAGAAPGNTQQTTPGNNQQTTPGNNQQTTPGNNQQTTPGNNQQGTTGNTQQGTTGNTQQGTTGNTKQGATGNTKQGATGNNQQNTPGNTKQGATGNNQQITPGNTQQGTTGNNKQGATGNTKQAAPGTAQPAAPGGAQNVGRPGSQGPSARRRQALTNDDQEEEVDADDEDDEEDDEE